MRYERFPECCAAAISCGFWAPNGRLYRFKEIDDFAAVFAVKADSK